MVVSLLRFRDWARQCMLLYIQMTTKSTKPNKQSKLKIQKQMKMLIQTGEQLTTVLASALTSEVAHIKNQANILAGYVAKVLDIMKVINKNKGVGPNNLEAFEKIVKVELPKTEMLVSISLSDESPAEAN